MGVNWPSVILDVFRSPIDASPAPVQYEALMWSGSPTVASGALPGLPWPEQC